MIYWFIHSIVLMTLVILIFKKWRGDLHPILFFSALTLKLFAGLLLGYIFLHYYGGGDTWFLFEEARDLARLPSETYVDMLFSVSDYEVSTRPRVLFFAKFLSLLLPITNGSYWIVSLYLSFISFCAYWYITLVITKVYPTIKSLAVIVFLFVPSVVFWSSGVLKGSIANSALVVLIALFLDHRANRLARVAVAVLCVFILFKVKHYLLISSILFFGVYFAVYLLTTKRGLVRIASIFSLLIAAGLTQVIHPYLKVNRLAQTLYENNQAIIQKTDEGSQIGIEISSAKWKDIIRAAPRAILTGLFRPTLNDRIHIWGWIHTTENTLVAMLTILSVLLLYKHPPTLDIPLLTAAIVSIIVLASLLALSTPNFGTLVRYKNAFMPFWMLIVSILPFNFLTGKGENYS